MEENELSTLEIAGEHPPIEEADTVDAPEVPDGEHPPEIDEVPDSKEIETEKKRLARLKKQREKAERETGYWRRKEAEAREEYRRSAEPPARAEATPTAIKTEPREDDYDDYTQFVTEHAKWVASEAVIAAREQWDREAVNKANAEKQQQRDMHLKSELEKGYGKYDDFEEVVFDRTATHITPMIVDILTECKNPADVAYNLANDRVNGIKISRMTPTMAAREIGKIDERFSGDGKTPLSKQSTGAPPPIKPVGSQNTAGNKDLNKMTQQEFNEYREKQGAKRF